MNCRRLLSLVAALMVLATPAHAQLLSYWDFSSNANDAVTGSVASFTGGATVAGGVLNLDGTGFVEFAPHLVPTGGTYSVALFMRSTGPQASYAEFISQGFSGGPGFYIGTDGGNGLRATDLWYEPTGASTGFGQDGAFHHYALTVGASDSWFYIDGALVGQRGYAISTTTGGTGTRLGNQFCCYGEYVRGQLDDVRIYGNTLSASEVRDLANGVVATPEPASLMLLCTGLVGIAGVARRRRLLAPR